MATVRPGMLRAATPDRRRCADTELLPVVVRASRVRVVARSPLAGDPGAALETADLVLGVGKGVGGPEGVTAVAALAKSLGAALAATRDVTDAGWLPRQLQ